MDRADATVCFVPREVFCQTRQALETLYRRTAEPFSLICVDGFSPPDVAEYLQRPRLGASFPADAGQGKTTLCVVRGLCATIRQEKTGAQIGEVECHVCIPGADLGRRLVQKRERLADAARLSVGPA